MLRIKPLVLKGLVGVWLREPRSEIGQEMPRLRGNEDRPCRDRVVDLGTRLPRRHPPSALLDQKHYAWSIPIVINLLPPDATLPGQPLSQIQLYNVEGGAKKIELDIVLRGQLADIHFQQLLVHSILLEMEYRDKPAWTEGVPCIDPPAWLVEGLSTYLKNRYADVDVDIYKTLLKNGEMPALGNFLSQNSTGMNAASLKVYQAPGTAKMAAQNQAQVVATSIQDAGWSLSSPVAMRDLGPKLLRNVSYSTHTHRAATPQRYVLDSTPVSYEAAFRF